MGVIHWSWYQIFFLLKWNGTEGHLRLVSQTSIFIWDKVFKRGPIKICQRQPLNDLKGYGLLTDHIPFKCFKGCFPQILLGSLWNTLFHMNTTSSKVGNNKTCLKMGNVLNRKPLTVRRWHYSLKCCFTAKIWTFKAVSQLTNFRNLDGIKMAKVCTC